MSVVTSSRIVAYHDLKRNWQKHEERLIKIKPTFQTRLGSCPSLKHKINMSKAIDVEFENKSLLKKLTQRSNSKIVLSHCPSRHFQKSNRKQYYENYKIRMENEGMYQRVKGSKPCYDTERFQQQRKKTEQYINTISKFGYKNLKPNKTQVKFQMNNSDKKYLTKRRFQCSNIQEKEQRSQSPNKSQQSPLRHKDYYLKKKVLHIGQKDVYFKAKKVKEGVYIELKNFGEKENEQFEELQALIPQKVYQDKYEGHIDCLIRKLRFDMRQNGFYVL